MAKTHRAIALDLPGYDLSDKPLDVDYSFEFDEAAPDGFLDARDLPRTQLTNPSLTPGEPSRTLQDTARTTGLHTTAHMLIHYTDDELDEMEQLYQQS